MKRGFTLVGLLFSLAILGTLVVAAMPFVKGSGQAVAATLADLPDAFKPVMKKVELPKGERLWRVEWPVTSTSSYPRLITVVPAEASSEAPKRYAVYSLSTSAVDTVVPFKILEVQER